MTLLSKYHYEKTWQTTSHKDLETILKEELPDAPVDSMIQYIKAECKKGKTVRLIDISFKAQ